MYYRQVFIDEIGDFDWDGLDDDEIGCVLYQIDIHDQIGKKLSCVTFDDDGFTVTLANPGYGDGFHSEDEDDDDDYDDF